MRELTDNLRMFAVEAGDLNKQLAVLADEAARIGSEVITATAATHNRSPDRPFRVVLMGRTTAGKSTLFEYLTEGDGLREGDGSQRYSKEACIRPSPILGIDLVDTPGVGYSGQEDTPEDYERAFAEVPDADLILWVASTLATQESTGRALTHLAALGKPVVIALNCSSDLRQSRNFRRLRTEPERIFGGEALDYLKPIRRYLAQAGADFVATAPIHAQAALWSRTHPFPEDVGQHLAANSRVDDLIKILHSEKDRREQRRATAQCDRVGTTLRRAIVLLGDGIGGLTASSQATTQAIDIFEKRAHRRVNDARAEIAASIDEAIQARHKWIDHVQVDGDVNAQWTTESEVLASEIHSAATTTLSGLEEDLKLIADDIDDDLESFAPGEFKGLPGSGESWANIASKGGVRAVVYGALLFLDFTPLAPIAVPVNIAVGLLDAVFGKQLNKLIDKIFRSKAETTRLRHERIREQLAPMLNDVRRQALAAANEALDSWTFAIRESVDKQRASAKAIVAAVRVSTDALDKLMSSLSCLDTDLTRELLRLTNRHRLARNVLRATRLPGRAIAVELGETDHAELALFPADTVEPLAPNAAHLHFPSGAALQVVAGLSPTAVVVTNMTRLNLDLVVPRTIPAGVCASWETLAFRHTGVGTSIKQGDEE